MKKSVVTFLAIILTVSLFAQKVQTIRGKVLDEHTGVPLIGATVVLQDAVPVVGTVTDLNGYFKLENVPVGRQGLVVSFVGYAPRVISALPVQSGKETVLSIELEEKVIVGEEIVIKANSKTQTVNDMALISARSFTVEETERYAGSYGDVSRMAANFAGVAMNSDQMNDIIIRGNSPMGLLWRLEGVDIPNPNHFGSMGSTGGPISMLNNNTLSNSDFYTGAFPAQYGNATSGVFDLQMRNGNNEKREYLFQMGMNGLEAGLEGPFSKNSRASYLINYRYSTLGIFDLLGIEMGVPAVPTYQDLALKVNVPTKKAGVFSLFGLGGLNSIGSTEGEIALDTTYSDFSWPAKVGVIGASHKFFFNNTTSLTTRVAATAHRTGGYQTIYEDGIKTSGYGDQNTEIKYNVSTELKKKFNSKNTVLGGVKYRYTDFNYLDSVYLEEYTKYINLHNFDGNYSLVQSFVQWQHRFNDKLSTVNGVHFQYHDINNDWAIEPRASIKYKFLPKHSVNFGYGMHSQMQPTFIYFEETLVDTANEQYNNMNIDLSFSKSHQFVLGYDYVINSNMRIKFETYYQYLYDIPVSQNASYISMLNYGADFFGFETDTLVNKGTGQNYGVELTVEKFLSKNYYYLVTMSLFDSKYKGSDGIERNTAFNGNYVLNAVGGYEIPFKNQNSLTFNLKGIYAGGKRELPYDLPASIAAGEGVFDTDNAYVNKHRDYWRIDFRAGYKINGKRATTEIALDVTNLTARKNYFYSMYNADTQEIEEPDYTGIVPAFLIRVTW